MRKKSRILLAKSLYEMVKPHIRQAIGPKNIKLRYDSTPAPAQFIVYDQYVDYRCSITSDGDLITMHSFVDVYNYCDKCGNGRNIYHLHDPQCISMINRYLDNMVCLITYKKISKNLKRLGITTGTPYRCNSGIIFEVHYSSERLNLLLSNDGSLRAHGISYNDCNVITDNMVDYIQSYFGIIK